MPYLSTFNVICIYLETLISCKVWWFWCQADAVFWAIYNLAAQTQRPSARRPEASDRSSEGQRKRQSPEFRSQSLEAKAQKPRLGGQASNAIPVETRCWWPATEHPAAEGQRPKLWGPAQALEPRVQKPESRSQGPEARDLRAHLPRGPNTDK